MKKILLAIIMVLIACSAEAKIYVCLDKSTGEARGSADIDPKNIGGWANQFAMIEADESYRGLQGYEIKYENQTLRKATDQEIADYKQAQSDSIQAKKKQDMMDTLGITSDTLTSIKSMKAQ